MQNVSLLKLGRRVPLLRDSYRDLPRTESPTLLLQYLSGSLGQKATIDANHSINVGRTLQTQAVEQRTRGDEESRKFATNTTRSLHRIHQCAATKPTSKSSDNTSKTHHRHQSSKVARYEMRFRSMFHIQYRLSSRHNSSNLHY